VVPYYYSFCYKTVLVKHGSASLMFLWATGGGTVVFGLLLWAYFMAVFTSPGFVNPRTWRHAPHFADNSERNDVAVEVDTPTVTKLGAHGELRYCSKCALYKPDDAHHCSDCNRCVTKMDHHCPWINNCVGRGNEKFFFQFIAYVPVAAAHIVATIVTWYYVSPTERFAIILAQLTNVVIAFVAATFGLVLGCFTLFHAHLIATSQTTLERRFRVASSQRRSWFIRILTCNLPPRSILALRFREVLGPDWRLWWLPVSNKSNSPPTPTASPV
jgi:hypothetical protein